MKTFNNLGEMQPYYNAGCNAYIFVENQKMIDVKFNFDLNTNRNINAWDIVARNINACNINACNINACNINARNINASNINAGNITAIRDINAGDINAGDINAGNINAWNINACNIEFYAVCFSYKTFVCDSVKGNHKNARYFCLDSDVVINGNGD